MNLINFFILRKKTPAHIAKKRLKIIISQKKLKKDNIPHYLLQLKDDLIKTIYKYPQINHQNISIQFEKKNDNTSILELNIILHETNKIKKQYNI